MSSPRSIPGFIFDPSTNRYYKEGTEAVNELRKTMLPTFAEAFKDFLRKMGCPLQSATDNSHSLPTVFDVHNPFSCFKQNNMQIPSCCTLGEGLQGAQLLPDWKSNPLGGLLRVNGRIYSVESYQRPSLGAHSIVLPDTYTVSYQDPFLFARQISPYEAQFKFLSTRNNLSCVFSDVEPGPIVSHLFSCNMSSNNDSRARVIVYCVLEEPFKAKCYPFFKIYQISERSDECRVVKTIDSRHFKRTGIPNSRVTALSQTVDGKIATGHFARLCFFDGEFSPISSLAMSSGAPSKIWIMGDGVTGFCSTFHHDLYSFDIRHQDEPVKVAADGVPKSRDFCSHLEYYCNDASDYIQCVYKDTPHGLIYDRRKLGRPVLAWQTPAPCQNFYTSDMPDYPGSLLQL